MSTKRKRYTAEFKAEAVKLVLEQGLTRAQTARDLGVSESVLCKWVRKAERKEEPATLTGEERDELLRLRKQVQVLRTEREILKKAAAFFAKENL